jgi:SagB-type dehydrogenase family enzyme
MALSTQSNEPKATSSLYLSSDLFFLLRDGNLILWDYKNHQQFTLNSSYFERLLLHARGEAKQDRDSDADIDQHLLKEGILLTQRPKDPHWKWDALSYIFHIGTRNVEEDSHASNEEWLADYISNCKVVVNDKPSDFFVTREGPITPLNPPNLEALNELSFQEILKQRQTTRNFNGKPVSLDILSTLLFVTFGLFHGPWQELSEAGLCEIGARKTSASGGGLHPNEAYITIHNVEGIEPGIYHYDVMRHGLVKVNDRLAENQLAALCMGQPFGEGVAFGVFLVAYFDKIWWKYPHSRGYRVALLDAGHLSQTFQLVSTALGILTWMTANIHDVNISTLLKLDGVHEAPIHFLAGGYGQKSGVYHGVSEYFKKS